MFINSTEGALSPGGNLALEDLPLARSIAIICKNLVLPDPFSFAAERVRSYLVGLHCEDDPDDLIWASLLIKFDEREGAPRELLGAKLSNAMTLPQAMLSKRQMTPDRSHWWTPRIGRRLSWRKEGYATQSLQEKIGIPEFAFTYEAIYRRSKPQVYAQGTQAALDPLDFANFVWRSDLLSDYQQHIDRFWALHETSYPLLMKAGLLRAALYQQQERSLGREQAQRVLRVLGLSPEAGWDTARIRDFRDGRPDPNVTIQPLIVHRYTATDIMVIRERGRNDVVLYVPGNSSPLHGFEDEDRLREWIVQQCRDDHRRASLAGHFRADDRVDGGLHYGVDTALRGLAIYPLSLINIGRWSPQRYITFAEPLQDAPFEVFAEAVKLRTYADGEQLISTKMDYYRDEAIEGLDALVTMVGCVCLVVPELLPLMMILSAAQAGVGATQMASAKDSVKFKKGTARMVFGLLNAVGSSGNLLVGSQLAENAVSRPVSGLKQVAGVASEQLWSTADSLSGEPDAAAPLSSELQHAFPALPDISAAAQPVPAMVHAIHLDDSPLPAHWLAALNAMLRLGLHVTLHVAGNPAALREAHPGIAVERLQDKRFFIDFLAGPGGHACQRLSGLGMAQQTRQILMDMLPYGLIHELGGIYIDLDTTLVAWPIAGLRAGPHDILLGGPVRSAATGKRQWYGRSVFASQAGNPLVELILNTGHHRLADLAENTRPEAIAGALSDATGLGLFNDMLELHRADYYGLALIEVKPQSTSAAFQARYHEVLNFYFPFRAEGSAPARAS